MALFPNKNCTIRDIISLRKNIFRIGPISKKYGGCPREDRVTRMRCQKRFIILKFQNIILSVADSGVIKR